MRVITSVAAESGYRLRLMYAGGDSVTVDFARVIALGGALAPLKDGKFFSRVSIGAAGRSLEWPGGIDFCADALWLEGTQGGVFPSDAESAA
ncbi:MAG: DUF2442 domain-containing protein [Nitrospinae bacterium]|nr:DUF2442 domain-containing protein [Nitrospinota bacterium]